MGLRQFAALAALICAGTPAMAFDLPTHASQGVKFYISIPLEARNAKEQAWSAGFAIQGKRDYEAVKVDSRMINNFIGGGIEAKWIIAGVVAAGAVAAVATKDKSTTASQQQAQAQQSAQSGGGTGTGTGTFHPDGTPHFPGDNCACHQVP
jgi:hypothetical protein